MSDAYWDELGIAWRATLPDIDLFTQRLRRKLRRQAIRAQAERILTFVLLPPMALYGVFLVWKGLFGGGAGMATAVGLMTLIVVAAAVPIQRWVIGRDRGDAESLLGMLDLAISRAERGLRAEKGFYAAGAMAIAIVATGQILLALGVEPVVPRRGPPWPYFSFVAVYVGLCIALGRSKRRRALRDRERFTQLKAQLGERIDL